jgi:hypothetical protein
MPERTTKSTRITEDAQRLLRAEFARRMEQAQQALLGGKTTTLAYSLGVDEADVERVGGVASA